MLPRRTPWRGGGGEAFGERPLAGFGSCMAKVVSPVALSSCVLLGIFVFSLMMVEFDDAELERAVQELHDGKVRPTPPRPMHKEQQQQHSMATKLKGGYDSVRWWTAKEGEEEKEEPFQTHHHHSLRVYIYDDIEPSLNEDLRGSGLCSREYSGAEVLLPHLVAHSDVYTGDGDQADFYLVPILSECFLEQRHQQGFDVRFALAELSAAVGRALDQIQRRHPYWSRAQGRDHIFIFPSERGAGLLHDNVRSRLQKSIFITGFVPRTSSLANTWKDITIPPAWDVGESRRKAMGMDVFAPPSSEEEEEEKEREFLLHFRGHIPGYEQGLPFGLRASLHSNFLNRNDTLFEPQATPCLENCSVASMLKSKFCVCAGGVEGWSMSFFEALAARCVPVIVNDDVEFPFEDSLDYSKFSMKVAESEVDSLYEIVANTGEETYRAKLQALMEARSQLFFSQKSPQNGAFDMVLSLLTKRVRYMRNSMATFWT